MKRLPIRLVFPVFTMLAIPLVYNSCQGGLVGGGGFKSNASKATCKAALENGRVTKLEINSERTPSEFSLSKVRLKEDAPANAKTTGPMPIPQGSKLAAILSNECLLTNAGELSGHVISSHAIESGTLRADLARQAYEWTTDSERTDVEIEALAEADPCVIGVSWNREYGMQAVFNDSLQVNQAHMVPLRAFESYDRFYSARGGMTAAGSPIVIAVIDTGVDHGHPDLQNNMWSHSNGIGIDITTKDSGMVDYNPFDVSAIGHGTHVAGIIAAVSNNRTGVVGLVPARAQIMGIKVFSLANGELSTTSQYFYNALNFARLNGANVINLSLGSLTQGPASDSLAAAGIEEAVKDGVTVITVIGNSEGGANGQLVNGTTFASIPAQYATREGVMAVGAYDVSSGMKSFFSHYSPTLVEISAPGAEQGSVGIYSTLPRSKNSYGRLAGTSQAGPMVTAAAALTIGILRDAYGQDPTPQEVEHLIVSSAVKSSSLTQYFKDGNKLDLMSLAQKINSEWPKTMGGGSAGTPLPSLGCPN